MKTLQYIIFIFSALLLSTFGINAQTVTQTCNNKTYVFASVNKKVYRLNSARSNLPKLSSEHFHAQQITPFNDIYKQVLSTERLSELAGKISIVSICCNPYGVVQSVEFLFMDEVFFTVNEIEQLESAILNYKFNMVFDSEAAEKENRNYYFAMAYRFPSK